MKLLTLLMLSVGSFARLYGHDMWIEPTVFNPQPVQIVSIRLRVGQDMIGDPIPYSAQLAKQFTTTSGALVPREGGDPAGLFRADGPAIIAYLSNPSSVEQAPEKFDRYLQEEGLNKIKPSYNGKPVRELFTRCAKAVLGGAASAKPLGLPLELIAEPNGSYRLLWQSKPLAGAQVVAMNKSQKLTARTDAQGRVKFALPPGSWMIKAVHMLPATPAENADFHSYWASLTFEISK
jgi:hypothetical protein